MSAIVGKRPPPAKLLGKLAATPAEQQFTTAINVGELIYGAFRSDRPEHFLKLLDELIIPRVGVLPFDESAGREYGELRALLERAGTPVAEPDLRIAATARSRGFTMATGNVGHFSNVPGLQVEDWLRG